MKVEYFDSKNQNASIKFTIKGTFIFNCQKIIFIALEKEQKISFWQIPNNYCNYSIILQAENQLDVTAVNERQQFPTCIFTQFDGNYFFLSISISPNSHSSIFFYSKDISKPQTCKNKFNCDYHSFQPFFARIISSSDIRDFKITLSYKTHSSSAQKDSNCQVLSLPTVTKNGFALLPTFAGDSAVVCTNLAQGTMNTLISLIITILLTITVLFLIHCIGAINFLHICKLDEQMGEFSGYHKAGIKDDPGPLLD